MSCNVRRHLESQNASCRGNVVNRRNEMSNDDEKTLGTRLKERLHSSWTADINKIQDGGRNEAFLVLTKRSVFVLKLLKSG